MLNTIFIHLRQFFTEYPTCTEIARHMITILYFLLFVKPVIITDAPVTFQELSLRIVQFTSQKDYTSFVQLSPGVEEWKTFDPKQMEGLSEAQIQTKIEQGNIPRLKRQLNAIVEDARSHGVKMKEIEFNNVKVQRFSDDPAQPVKLEIMFYYDHMSGRFSAKAAEINGHWYLLDFLQEESPFKDIRVQGGNSMIRPTGYAGRRN